MRLQLSLLSSKPIVLDTNYQQQVQGWLYHVLSNKDMQAFLHNKGFAYGKRQFRLFCFSRILGRSFLIKNTKQLEFKSPVRLVISSPWIEFLQNLANSIITKDFFSLGNNHLEVNELRMEKTPAFNSEEVYKIDMLSPVTMYSTLETKEGRKKTYYYSPVEKEFSQLLKRNLVKKAQAFYNEDWSQLPFNIEPAGDIKAGQQKIVIFKGTVIKGWMGQYKISGDTRMLKLAYESGMGGKNSQGFGMFSLLSTATKKHS